LYEESFYFQPGPEYASGIVVSDTKMAKSLARPS